MRCSCLAALSSLQQVGTWVNMVHLAWLSTALLMLCRPVEWVLVDGIVGGSGEKFDWGNLESPRHVAQHGWFLAGGLGPHNVAEAVQQLHPTGVDVSSGVTGPDKLSKDPVKVHAFVSSAQSAIVTHLST